VDYGTSFDYIPVRMRANFSVTCNSARQSNSQKVAHYNHCVNCMKYYI